MKASCCIYNYHIGIIGSCGTQCVKSDRSRVSTHFLLYNRYTYPFTPYHQLLHSSSTESIGSTQINRLSGFLELISQFANRSSLPYTIDAHYHNDVWFLRNRCFKVIHILRIILCKQRCDFIT